MNLSDNLKIEDIENYINTIFDLRSKLIDYAFKISLLEFELSIEKQSHEFTRKLYVPKKRKV